MALFSILAALAFALILLLTGKRIRFTALVAPSGVSLRFSFLGIPFARQYSYERLLGMIAFGEKREKHRKEKLGFWDFRKAFRFNGLNAHGKLGFAGDAAATAVFCGALGCALEAAFAALTQDGRFSVRVTPEFTRKTFWLYLEGMLKIYPGKIIIAFAGKRLKEEYEKWRILSRTLWKRPWQSSGKWSM
ncbi:MAG: hypothetical protein BWY35_01794 [Firmicutes bacterium ADurb.Bin248]|nr:MAG: hypothetical protein BWY35_01794 [Firmicutes bacterium ADurb.Bin248]